MELKTKNDFVNAFVACGKKYGFCKIGADHKPYGFCNSIPSELEDEKIYLYSKTTYKDAGSWTEHVTKEWNRSWGEWEPCKPHDVQHSYTDEMTVNPMFAWLVKPSYIGDDGKIHHVVTDIRGINFNRAENGTYIKTKHIREYEQFDVFGEIREYRSDSILTCNCHDSEYGPSFNHIKEKEVVYGIYYQHGKLYVNYTTFHCSYTAEAELANDWRAFTTYEEVLAFQQSEEKRLCNDAADLTSGHEKIQGEVKLLIEHAKNVLKDINDFKRKTNNTRNYQGCAIEDFIKAYTDFDFFAKKWVNQW